MKQELQTILDRIKDIEERKEVSKRSYEKGYFNQRIDRLKLDFVFLKLKGEAEDG